MMINGERAIHWSKSENYPKVKIMLWVSDCQISLPNVLQLLFASFCMKLLFTHQHRWLIDLLAIDFPVALWFVANRNLMSNAGPYWHNLTTSYRALVVAQLVGRALPIPEFRSSNPVIGKWCYTINCIEKTKIKKKEARNGPFFLKKLLPIIMCTFLECNKLVIRAWALV